MASSPGFAPRVAVAGAATAKWVIYDTLGAVEPIWRELESRAVMTPYQRFDWIAACVDAGLAKGETLAFLVMSTAGRPIAILPLQIGRAFGGRVARVVGWSVSNGDGLIYDPAHAACITPAAMAEATRALAAHGRHADMLRFHHVAAVWEGHANPLMALPHTDAPNSLYVRCFETSDGPFIERELPHKRRTNIRRSQRRLEERFGMLSLCRARTPDDVEEIYRRFSDQRAKRFHKMGVENIFARPHFDRLLRGGALEALGGKDAVVTLHALYGGDTVLATSVGVRTPTHYSQYINSTAEGDAAKYSLMGVLMSLLMDELRADGVECVDMGLGDFDYKTDWTEAVGTHDIVLPVSARGRVLAPTVSALRAAKRTIKGNARLWRATRGLLAVRTRLRALAGRSR
ncbi:GNAT family N-acetyltransferase [Pelagibacterium montanilacus]|uniref:GNAT family N-acetyltransferase n=1 Tax=Pelagibacterium montanilacus TaxID=2185280 RepID=UPI0013DFBE9E|nr:GNAT family N-acetyltransferase [Pelagibacterium montanilacus]